MLDSFSGRAADLPPRQRGADDVLRTLAKHPRVSTWDMSKIGWLRSRIYELRDAGLVIFDDAEPYPWFRLILTDKGRARAGDSA